MPFHDTYPGFDRPVEVVIQVYMEVLILNQCPPRGFAPEWNPDLIAMDRCLNHDSTVPGRGAACSIGAL